MDATFYRSVLEDRSRSRFHSALSLVNQLLVSSEDHARTHTGWVGDRRMVAILKEIVDRGKVAC